MSIYCTYNYPCISFPQRTLCMFGELFMNTRIQKLEQRTQSSSFEEKRSLLKKSLSNPFRYGTSAFRLGLIQIGASDHLPFMINAKLSDQSELAMVSWNLLADIHLYNNFMNISGMHNLINAMKEYRCAENIYYNENENKLFYFFAELAQYLYKNQLHNKIKITAELLHGFISTQKQESNLTRSRNLLIAEEKIKQVENARAEIIKIFLNDLSTEASEAKATTVNSHEFKLAIKHCLELIHHIQHTDGALRWSNRFKLIKNNNLIVKTMVSADFLCLQECSNPDDIQTLFQSAGKEHNIISYRVDKNTSDHCVLVYDSSKYDIVDTPIEYALEGKKPCIFAKFKNRRNDEVFIVASIHHPGGKYNLTRELLKAIEPLRQSPNNNIPFYLLGDYNHTQDFFQNESTTSDFTMIYPAEGTMAGSDYGNANRSVDAVLTNQDEQSLTASVISGLAISPPAPQVPVVVEFESNNNVAYPGFFQRNGNLPTALKNDLICSYDENSIAKISNM